MINNLPNDIQKNIYKIYFSKYIINQIKPKCFYHFKLGNGRPRNFRCNLNTIESAYCLACWRHFYNL